MSIPKRLPEIESPELVHEIHKWVDMIPLSRPKRNIARDFADAVLVAEIAAHYHPSFVELHNYPPSSSSSQKMFNWNTLNNKVCKKLGFGLNPQDMEDCANVLAKLKAQVQRAPPRSSRPGSGRPRTVEVRAQAAIAHPHHSVDELGRLLEEQGVALSELRKTVEILTQKNGKLEQLIEIKDKKIEALLTKLKSANST